MPVNEHSVGRLYLAQMRLEDKPIKRSWVAGVVQESDPWRRGKARALTIFKRRALLIGWWKKQPQSFASAEEAELFEDVQWLDPQQLFKQPEEIAEWDDGRTPEQRAELEALIEETRQRREAAAQET